MKVENISAILLASGLSRRMGNQDKLLLKYKGLTLIECALSLIDSLPLSEKILVCTPERVAKIAVPSSVRVMLNHNPQAGQSESLHLGTTAATGQGYLFFNADQPRLTTHSLEPLFKLARDNPGKIVYPAIAGKPNSPVLFPAEFRAALLEQTGDAGGRAVRAGHPQHCLSFEPQDPRDFMDVDSMEDYLALRE